MRERKFIIGYYHLVELLKAWEYLSWLKATDMGNWDLYEEMVSNFCDEFEAHKEALVSQFEELEE